MAEAAEVDLNPLPCELIIVPQIHLINVQYMTNTQEIECLHSMLLDQGMNPTVPTSLLLVIQHIYLFIYGNY